MSNLVFHPATKQTIMRVISQRPHAIALIGPEGAGKVATARYLADKFLDEARQAGSTYFEIVPNDKGIITIEQAREIKQFVKLKPANRKNTSRVIVLQDAHLLQVPAQNSLLKILEEPPIGTIFILTVATKESLLPTLWSRLTDIAIRPLAFNQIRLLTDDDISAEELKRAFYLSGGYAGMTSELINAGEDHPLIKNMAKAKQILINKKYARLSEVDEISANHKGLSQTMLCLQKILEYKLKTDYSPATAIKVRHCITAQDDLHRRVNKKLVLTDLFLKL